MKRIVILSVILCSYMFAISAQNYAKPKWIDQPPVSSSNDYFYLMAKGYGNSKDVAKEKMFQDVKKNIAETFGVPTTYVSSSNSEILASGEVVVKAKTSIEGESTFKVSTIRICDYMEGAPGSYVSYGLFQIAKRSNITNNFPQFRECNVMDKTPAGALVRSIIVPGWGQYYGGHRTNGAIILAATIATGAVALVANTNANEAYNNAVTTNNLITRQSYMDDYNQWTNVQTFSFVGLGLVYGYNLVTAIVSKPKTNRALAFVPSYDYTTQTMGATLSLKF